MRTNTTAVAVRVVYQLEAAQRRLASATTDAAEAQARLQRAAEQWEQRFRESETRAKESSREREAALLTAAAQSVRARRLRRASVVRCRHLLRDGRGEEGSYPFYFYRSRALGAAAGRRTTGRTSAATRPAGRPRGGARAAAEVRSPREQSRCLPPPPPLLLQPSPSTFPCPQVPLG